MTVYIANENGDWWEYRPGSVLYVIDTSVPEVAKAAEDDDIEFCSDKFEQFIQAHGVPVDIAKGAYKWE
jgi:hypothetical protein